MNKLKPIPPDVRMMEYSVTKRGLQKKKPLKIDKKATEPSTSSKRQRTVADTDFPMNIADDSFVYLDPDLEGYTGNVSVVTIKLQAAIISLVFVHVRRLRTIFITGFPDENMSSEPY
jgi:hypothetical protein